MTQEITGKAFKDMIINAASVISNNKQQLNELNVFPVPDGDTGTNMSLTMGSGSAELSKKEFDTVTSAADAMANALLRGARGNSGVIISLLFRGMAKSLKGIAAADSRAVAAALKDGVTAAYNAVMKPAEGTILTVSRLAADAAVLIAEEESDVEVLLEEVIKVANTALANTVNQNPVLKKAGVIDAGGKGYVYILHGMLSALRGEMAEARDEAAPVSDKATFSDFDTGEIAFAYCTEFIVNRENYKSPRVLRDFLDGMGDSLVLVDDDEIIKVHVHTNEPGKVLTEAMTYGSFASIKIENMKLQHTEQISSEEADDAHKVAPPEKKYGIVAVCAGDGMADVFRDLGVDNIVTGGQTMNPSTEDILRAVNRTPAEIVFVFPNNKNIIMAAEQCMPLTEKKVVVIPTRTVPQGVSALLSMDASMDEDSLSSTFTDAASSVHTVQITYAARDSEFDGQSIKSGEYLALLESSLLSSGPDLDTILDVSGETLSAFSPEFITIFYGEDVDEASACAAMEKLSKAMPDVEITLVSGGQPVYYYMISAE